MTRRRAEATSEPSSRQGARRLRVRADRRETYSGGEDLGAKRRIASEPCAGSAIKDSF